MARARQDPGRRQKGVRRTKSRFGRGLEPGWSSASNGGAQFDTVTQAVTIQSCWRVDRPRLPRLHRPSTPCSETADRVADGAAADAPAVPPAPGRPRRSPAAPTMPLARSRRLSPARARDRRMGAEFPRLRQVATRARSSRSTSRAVLHARSCRTPDPRPPPADDGTARRAPRRGLGDRRCEPAPAPAGGGSGLTAAFVQWHPSAACAPLPHVERETPVVRSSLEAAVPAPERAIATRHPPAPRRSTSRFVVDGNGSLGQPAGSAADQGA